MTAHLDNRRILPPLRHIPIKEAVFCIAHPWMSPRWKRPETVDEVIACDRIDADLCRVVMLQEAWELDRAERRGGF